MLRPALVALATVLAIAACSSSDTPETMRQEPEDDAAPSPAQEADASPGDAGPTTPSSGGHGGLPCTDTKDIAGHSVCTTKVGSVELRILEATGGSGPLRLGLYLHGDGAGAHESGSIFKATAAWADAQHGLSVSALAPNGCSWWQTPEHDCDAGSNDPDLDGANAAALEAALEAVNQAYDVRGDGLRYYGSSGGSIFLTDEWIPLEGAAYPGVFAIMCGGDAPARAFAWDRDDPSLRARSALFFTYGDKDFLYDDEQASVAWFNARGFDVTEKVIPGAEHCAFDGHGEAVGIWNANP